MVISGAEGFSFLTLPCGQLEVYVALRGLALQLPEKVFSECLAFFSGFFQPLCLDLHDSAERSQQLRMRGGGGNGVGLRFRQKVAVRSVQLTCHRTLCES